MDQQVPDSDGHPEANDAHTAAIRAAEAAERSLAFEQAEAQLGRALSLAARMPEGRGRNRCELDVQD
ncbi:MAG: hypothetical protein LC713_02515, partial [Actinobacteria bacterium]|nr:hypothetical protein [Actinomycetota bacterium]